MRNTRNDGRVDQYYHRISSCWVITRGQLLQEVGGGHSTCDRADNTPHVGKGRKSSNYLPLAWPSRKSTKRIRGKLREAIDAIGKGGRKG